METISQSDLQKAQQLFQNFKREMSKVIVGQEELIRGLWTALSTSRHLLLEGVPGLAKTLAVKTMAETLGLDFQRIQFTPDLLPGDLVGTLVFQPQKADFLVRKGPVFTQILLADEINRAPAKVQSALLEAMEEQQVTLGEESYSLPKPFFVLATQNPIEQEGTYPLPEAQLDRFFLKILMTYPERDQELAMLRSRSLANLQSPGIEKVATAQDILFIQNLVHRVKLDEAIEPYIVDLVRATRVPEDYGLGEIKPYIRCGASPRAVLAIALASRARALMEGRSCVLPEDPAACAFSVLRHRIILSYEAAADNKDADDLIGAILAKVEAP